MRTWHSSFVAFLSLFKHTQRCKQKSIICPMDTQTLLFLSSINAPASLTCILTFIHLMNRACRSRETLSRLSCRCRCTKGSLSALTTTPSCLSLSLAVLAPAETDAAALLPSSASSSSSTIRRAFLRRGFKDMKSPSLSFSSPAADKPNDFVASDSLPLCGSFSEPTAFCVGPMMTGRGSLFHPPPDKVRNWRVSKAWRISPLHWAARQPMSSGQARIPAARQTVCKRLVTETCKQIKYISPQDSNDWWQKLENRLNTFCSKTVMTGDKNLKPDKIHFTLRQYIHTHCVSTV